MLNVKSLLTKLELFCREKQLPMFATIGNEYGSEYITRMVTPASLGISKDNGRIADHILIANGFRAVPGADATSDNTIPDKAMPEYIDFEDEGGLVISSEEEY